jgi:indolepyruvate ferredoxin oxidoreductase beta subunit
MNVLICGVGGQGILLASDILAQAALNEGCDVKKSEVHGMAQRGGSVVSHVRFGAKVYSPLIEEETADFILAFEKLEGVRYLHFLAPKGTIIVDTLELPPLSVLAGKETYPLDIPGTIRKKTKHAYFIDGSEIAKKLGNIRTQNVVLLGALAHFLTLKPESITDALTALIKPKFLDLNLKAFALGKETIAGKVC